MNNPLKNHFERTGDKNASSIARVLGVSPQAVYSWLKDGRKPTPRIRRKLKKYFDVPLELWDEQGKDAI